MVPTRGGSTIETLFNAGESDFIWGDHIAFRANGGSISRHTAEHKAADYGKLRDG